MPDLAASPPTRLSRFSVIVREWAASLSYVSRNGLVSASAVVLVSLLLAALHLELQFVAGAFLVVFARRLAEKRLALPRERPLSPAAPLRRDDSLSQAFGPARDPMGEALSDYAIREPEDD